jgi:hypothetical protein
LIHIGTEMNPVLRLSESTRSEAISTYATLSHCWGKIVPFKLLASNISELKQGISLSQLPKTFQQAIVVTRQLSVEYIWIDSLCIIQDSKSDVSQDSFALLNGLCTLSSTVEPAYKDVLRASYSNSIFKIYTR